MDHRETRWFRRSHLFWHAVFVGLVLALLFLVLRELTLVLTPLAVALALAYLLHPVVLVLENRLHVPRWLGTTLLFLLAMVGFALVILLALPTMLEEFRSFAELIPVYLQKVQTSLNPWLERNFSVTIPLSLQELLARFGMDLKSIASNSLGPLGGMAGTLAQTTANVVTIIGILLLIPIFTFYFLIKFPEVAQGTADLIPRRFMPWVSETALEINAVISRWMRGQIIVMMFLATLYSIGFSLVHLRLAVFIGMLTGFLAFIPYLGVSIGATLALLVCILEYHGPGQLIGVAVVFGIVQTLEGLVLTPLLVGKKVGLGPVGVLIALLFAGQLFGFMGVLIAVPVAAALVVVIRRVLDVYRHTSFYKELKIGDQSEPRANK